MKKISYKISNGNTVVVEVTEEVASFLEECKQEEKREVWRAKKRKEVSLEYLKEINAQIADSTPTPLQILEQKETSSMFTWDLPLPHEFKVVVILHYRYGFTIREIAEKLKKPKSTIHHRLQSALKMLRVGQNDMSCSLYSVRLNAEQNKQEE